MYFDQGITGDLNWWISSVSKLIRVTFESVGFASAKNKIKTIMYLSFVVLFYLF